jgi:hypothetical protein
MLIRNPADAVDPPKVDGSLCRFTTFRRPWPIEAVRDTPVLVPTLLAVLCGLRRGEICALRWRNVDLVTGQISVVELRALTPAQELPRLGVRLSNDDLVISHTDGSVISPIYVSQHWARAYPHH